MKKIIIIICAVAAAAALFFISGSVISKRTVEDYIYTKYDNLNYSNFIQRYEETNNYIDESRIDSINPFPQEVAERFDAEKTYIAVESCDIKTMSMSDYFVVNSVFRIVYRSETLENFEQTVHYNVDYYLKRNGLFKFEIFDIIKNSSVSVMASQHEHEHEHDDEKEN